MSSQPFKVKAVFEYASPHDEDLNFPNGQIITVTEDDEEDWYTGEYVDASGIKKEGIFPRNFVEKYEPTAPPRPTRAPRPKKDSEAPIAVPVPEEPAVKESTYEPAEEEYEDHKEAPVHQASPPAPKTASVPTSPPVEAPQAAPQVSPKPAPSASKPAPPPVSEKPSGGSFKDRIAAFNKSAAPPPAPFKPGGLGGQSFIKKPFVAPPPSKNSYVPPPREPAPQKIYRRDEDPEIAARETENQENAERAGLAPTANDDEAEDRPKPTSLKERIALLQKQQQEQASRHADAAAKKEKPKRPAKKRTESYNTLEGHEDAEGADLERAESHDTIGKKSLESTREENTVPRGVPSRRKSSKGPPPLPRESFGDGNDADMSGAGDETEEHEETSTGKDDSDDKPRARAPAVPVRAPTAPLQEPDIGEEEGTAEEEEPQEEEDDEEEEDEDDVDPEIRRKEELRARMAKMSGGMGMHGMFGGGMPMPSALPPKKKKSSGSGDRKQSGEYGSEEVSSPVGRAPPVPGIPLPGMSRMIRSPEDSNKQLEVQHEVDETSLSSITTTGHPYEVPDIEDVKPAPPARSNTNRSSIGAPPVPGGRPAPPPVPTDSRPTIARVPTQPMSPSAGSESDDDLSSNTQNLSLQTPAGEVPNRGLPPRPPQGAPSVPSRSEVPSSPHSPTIKRASYFGNETSPTSPTASGTTNKRASRPPPPIPGTVVPVLSSQNRGPPPPPPNALSLSRSSTGDGGVLKSAPHFDQDESDEEVTEYEGDYDTDIASTAPRKDALTKAHSKDASFDDVTPVLSPVTSPFNAPPPLPLMGAPRAMPPPLPSQPPPHSRQPVDMPRSVPPPPPPPKENIYTEEEDDYDPYKYAAPKGSVPVAASSRHVEEDENEDEDIYSTSPPRSKSSIPQERATPQPPSRDPGPILSTGRAPLKQSADTQRGTSGIARRSTDLSRISMDSGFVANDVDLAHGTLWWTHTNGVPPVFQNRKDILYESEESTATKRGGKSITTKDLYILFQDYSQTVVTVVFDPQNPSDASLEQRHEHPPSRLRQDQLEDSHERFGRRIAADVATKKDTVVGDGTPQGLVQELLRPLNDALLPVGTRAYGALVYANLANASTSLNDEIRPGDIITLRNAKFQGKHGPMHAKYSSDVGTAGVGHVGIVAEWDGTKKKIRAWEQGREKKKVALESFKLDDLRSGEVKVWRVMPRGWVGWEGQN